MHTYAAPAATADFRLIVDGLEEGELRITGLTGREAISELFGFHLDLTAADAGYDPADMIGSNCRLEIEGVRGERHIHGLISEFELTGIGHSRTRYRAVLRPVVSLLCHRRQRRRFVRADYPGLDVPKVIRQVLEDAGVPPTTYRFALQRDYAEREMIVQYDETDFDFISRLMEHEGIFYYFEQTDQGTVMVLGDTAAAHRPNPLDSEFVFRPESGFAPDPAHARFGVARRPAEYVHGVSDARQIGFGAVALDDYDFVRPAKDLRCLQSTGATESLCDVQYPGGYQDLDLGQRFAAMRLEAAECLKKRVAMQATVRCFVPGHLFSLVEHPVTRLNRDYLAVSVEHRLISPEAAEQEGALADQSMQYLATLQVLPTDQAFRPQRRVARPFVRGTQTARVVGPQGGEIYTDKYGRVKLQFHWDQEGQFNERGSCWVRVSHAMAGGGYGAMFLPRVGQEVIVDFLEGDPDQPVIVGRVYNGDHMPPYQLPASKTISTIKTHSTTGGGGTNEIRFEDRKDNEQLLFFAQRDLHTHVNRDAVSTTNRDTHNTVQRDQYEAVRRDSHRRVGQDSFESIDGNLHVDVRQDRRLHVGGAESVEVDGTRFVHAKRRMVFESDESITLRVGGNFIEIDQNQITIYGHQVKVNCSGARAADGVRVPEQRPRKAGLADTVVPGRDVRYAVEAVARMPGLGDRAARPQLVAVDWDEAPAGPVDDRPRERETSWIAIRLIDEEHQPVPHERYRLRLEDGTVIEGRLDDAGEAYHKLETPQPAEVCFPDIDGREWRRHG